MEKIAVIGIGRLGLCLALNLERSGYSLLGLDVNENYVKQINDKTFYSPEPLVTQYLKEARNFKATTHYRQLFEETIRTIFVVLPTPSLPAGDFDHSYIDKMADELTVFGVQKEKHFLIINSTTIPGYCGRLQQRLTAYNYEVIYNPEFIAQGSIIRDQLHPDQVLIGEASSEAGNVLLGIYGKMCLNQPAYCRMSRISAEITKLATNCFLTTKISFANAVGDIATKAGAEPEKVLEAIGVDSRIGNKYFKYGFGFGGPCFPRDNKAFVKFADDFHYNMLISEATDKANQKHAEFLFEEWTEKHQLSDAIEFDSVTYKKGTDILEESQQLKLAVALAQSGKKVIVKEKLSVVKKLMDDYGDLFTYQINE